MIKYLSFFSVIPAGGRKILNMDVTGCADDADSEINYMEHLGIRMSLIGGVRGDLSIHLISPAGMALKGNSIQTKSCHFFSISKTITICLGSFSLFSILGAKVTKN